jgi:hypothetical protein
MRIIAISLAAFAVYLPAAYLAGRNYIPAPKPVGELVEPLLGVVQGDGSSYRAQSYSLGGYVDASEDNMHSPVMLYEGLKPLGPARSYIREVQDVGLGRFNFIRFSGDPRSHVVFSTSDNSDPRTNGRNYWLVLPVH